MRVGLILGGGGEVGIAWEIGVLAALEQDAGFIASTSAVIAGTSAGAIVGAYAAQGRSMSADPVWHRSVPMSSMQSPRTNGSDPYCRNGAWARPPRGVSRCIFARSSKIGMCCWRPIVLRRAVNRTVDIDAALVPYERQLVFSGISTLSGQPATAFPAGPSSAGLPVGASSNRA